MNAVELNDEIIAVENQYEKNKIFLKGDRDFSQIQRMFLYSMSELAVAAEISNLLLKRVITLLEEQKNG